MSNYTAATTEINAGALTWTSDGYYVMGDSDWQNITVTSSIVYNGGEIGLSPRIYEDNMYMTFSLENKIVSATEEQSETIVQAYAKIDAQITYEKIHLADKYIEALVIGQQYIIKAETNSTNYKFYVDDVLIFNIEYAGMTKGKIGIYSTIGNSCLDVEVKSLFPDGWTSNVAQMNGAIVDIKELADENKYLYLSKSAGVEQLYVEQSMDLVGSKNHTLSFLAEGTGKAQVIELNGIAPSTYEIDILGALDWTPYSMTNLINSDCTQIKIRFYVTNTELKINNVQFEEKDFQTGYIHNQNTTGTSLRESSLITFPAKDNINVEKGTLSIWIKPMLTYDALSNRSAMIFEYGTSIKLFYQDGKIQFNSNAVEMSLTKDTWYHLVGVWSETEQNLYIDGVEHALEGYYPIVNETAQIIHIGSSASDTYSVFYGAIDETIVYGSTIEIDEVKELYASSEPIKDSTSMIMRATFNYAIGNFNKSIIEAALIPNYGSPVLATKSDGTAMRKVSFFDYYTGEYRTFNEEMVEYNKRYDYVEISFLDKDVDQESFKIIVKDIEGTIYGGPYILKGRKLYLNLTGEEKESLEGENLYISYQLENSYTVDYNIDVADSFRVTLGKHDGQPVSVTYEGNRFTDEKLASMIELNPMLSPNHQGFLYVTRNDEKVSSFKIKATPGDVQANGGSETLIIVEPLDINGNYIGHCNLSISCEKGAITPAYDIESIKLRERAGRFLYRYRAPLLKLEEVQALEVQENIDVIDKETGIGVKLPITLTTLQNKLHVVLEGSTLDMIALKYGVTLEDIAYANSLTITQMKDKILESVGQSINIPINYSASQLIKSSEEAEEEAMAAYLVWKVTDHMNKPSSTLPEGLGALLDFNSDGIINLQEIVWIGNNKYTTALQNKYNEIVAWYNAN